MDKTVFIAGHVIWATILVILHYFPQFRPSTAFTVQTSLIVISIFTITSVFFPQYAYFNLGLLIIFLLFIILTSYNLKAFRIESNVDSEIYITSGTYTNLAYKPIFEAYDFIDNPKEYNYTVRIAGDHKNWCNAYSSLENITEFIIMEPKNKYCSCCNNKINKFALKGMEVDDKKYGSRRNEGYLCENCFKKLASYINKHTDENIDSSEIVSKMI